MTYLYKESEHLCVLLYNTEQYKNSVINSSNDYNGEIVDKILESSNINIHYIRTKLAMSRVKLYDGNGEDKFIYSSIISGWPGTYWMSKVNP